MHHAFITNRFRQSGELCSLQLEDHKYIRRSENYVYVGVNGNYSSKSDNHSITDQPFDLE